MKQITKLINIVGVLFLMFALGGCYYDDLNPDSNIKIDTEISFSTNIVPIFNGNCNIVGCHSSGDNRLNLSANAAYNELTAGGYINTSNPKSSELYLWTSGKKDIPMPPGGVDPVISATLLAWIEQGAKNN